MGRRRIRWLAILAVAATVDLTLTLHAILTRHVPHVASGRVATGPPRVMSAADLLGCLCALLLIAGMAAIIGDGISMARRAARSSQPRIRIIDI